MHKFNCDTIQAELNIRNNNVYCPASQGYSNVQTSANTSKYLIEATSELKSICHQFSNIHLKLKPVNTDVRPFLWNDFICLKRYTYTVNLAELNKEQIENIPEIKKWQALQVRQEVLNIEDVHQHITFLKPYVKQKRLKVIQTDLLENLQNLNVLNITDEHNNTLAQMIFNIHQTEAQQLFYYINDESKKKRIGVFAQYAFMFYFKEKGYITFDFCGANIPTIAEYKSSFPVKLESFYELWYHRNPLKSLAHRWLFHQV
jgi:hypothetical protein